MSAVLIARGVAKSYSGPSGAVPVLLGVDLEIEPGEIVAILGASGSGKSTLLHVLGALDSCDAGTIEVDGVTLGGLTPHERAQLRRRSIGFVFQFHHLLPEFTALENVAIPERLRGRDVPEATKASRAALEALGLGARLDHAPGKLSGGEQQRVAVARALVGTPKLLLADEPTGNLDAATAALLFEELRRYAKEKSLAIVWATHNEVLAQKSDRAVRLVGGRLTSV